MTKSHVLLILVGFIVYIIIEKNAKFLFEVCVIIFFLIKFMDSPFPMEPRTRIPSFILSWLIPPYYKLSHRFLLGCVEFSALQYMWHVPVWLFSATEFLPFTLLLFFKYCLWLFPCCKGRIEPLQQRSCDPESLKHLLFFLFQKKVFRLCLIEI